MKKSLFKNNQKYFHLNIDFATQPLFKGLDWIYIQKSVQVLLLEYSVQVHALVMMDTHIHLLIQSDNQKENYFSEALQKSLNKKSEMNADFYCEPISEYAQYLNCYKYIYRNPVEACLVSSVENYTFSSLGNLLGKTISYCEVIDHLALIQNPTHVLNWLNNKIEFRYSKLSQMPYKNNLPNQS